MPLVGGDWNMTGLFFHWECVAEVAQGAIGHTHQIKCSSVAKEDENDVGWI